MHPRAGRYTASGLRTSLLSVPGVVGAEAVGLRPIGEVMGCVVEHADDLAASMRRGYATALDRLRAEASALGADGVLAIGCTVTRVSATVREFVVLGTAVRASRGKRPPQPFTTGLPGPDVAKLMLAGWVPVTLAIGIDDGTAYDLAMTGRPGEEATVPTELVTRVRAAARAEFLASVHRSGADGGLVTSTTLRAWALGHTGAAAVASVFGTAVARFGAGPVPTASLPVLPLDGNPPGVGR
ncbi:heavy metal-binding domain-containing protein [Amycolatopsis mongoliensis]|uniref:Heavy metal-binding domain-containing protein n=1 Tax=Amycolatopsis mongoliensis TaxID=715475 RepID=A0A9Y2NIN3_9PSEU|nr:heavy metal-binding domain-containing protein [Amycolatopsis sp. 4-36]WIY03119.1 heavy metal-binding domain-containing protein [Amycolatopsis sp. 4-36]